MSLANGSSILFIVSKNQLLILLIFAILALDNWSLLFVWCPVQISFSGLSTCVSAYILILGNSFQFVFSSNTLEIEREVLRRQRSKWLRMACSLFRKAFQRDEFRNDF